MDGLYFKLMDGAFGRNGAGPFDFPRYNPLIENGFERDTGIRVRVGRMPDDDWKSILDELGIIGQKGSSSIYVVGFGAAVKPYNGLVEYCKTNFHGGIHGYCCPVPSRQHANGQTIPLFVKGHAIYAFQRTYSDRHSWISMELLRIIRSLVIRSMWQRMGSLQSDFATLIGRSLKNDSVPANAFLSLCLDYLESIRIDQDIFVTNALLRPLVQYRISPHVKLLREFFDSMFERTTLEKLSWQATESN
jgi:hypothetical protein